jgi:hypothetical protein
MGVWMPCLGATTQLACLLLFDVGCASWMVMDGKRRGAGYWLAFVSAMIRLLIAFMNLVGWPIVEFQCLV